MSRLVKCRRDERIGSLRTLLTQIFSIQNMKIIPLSVPTPFYIGDVNVYLIKEEPITLIDVGPKTAEAEKVLREKLKQNGVDLADIQRIFLTHAHVDHSGLTKKVRDQAKDAEVFIHDWETGHLFEEFDETENEKILQRAGIPDEILHKLREIYKKMSVFTDALKSGEFSALSDTTEFEFSSGMLKVLHTPGHTPGSCSFVREANRTVICGDTVLKRITPNPIISPDPFNKSKRFNSIGEYLVSLAKIRSYAPTLVYGGHGEPIFDYEEIFNRYVRRIDDRQKKLISLIPENGATIWELTKELFPDAIGSDVHRFLAISETVAHLDYAETQDKIATEIGTNAEIYQRK